MLHSIITTCIAQDLHLAQAESIWHALKLNSHIQQEIINMISSSKWVASDYPDFVLKLRFPAYDLGRIDMRWQIITNA